MSEQLQLCDFEQAKLLKESGFDWEVISFYDKYGKAIAMPNSPTKNNNNDEYYSAPTVALALKWLRDVKGLHCYADKANSIP